MKSLLRKRKGYFLTWMFIIVVLFSTGCGFKDIDKRIFVIAVGIDKGTIDENSYKVTLKLAIPTGSQASPKPEYTYLTEESATITEAIRTLKSYIDKELDFGHTKVIVLGENIIEQDMRKVVDFFIRRRDFQQISWVAVGKPSAEDILKVQPSAEMAGSNILFNIFSGIGTESTYIVSTYLFEFRRQMIESGIDPVLPIIETNKKGDKLILNKSIVFSGNKGKLHLSPGQTEEYNILSNSLETINLDMAVEEEDLNFTAFIDQVKVDYKILTPSRKRPILKMNIHLTGIVEESKTRLSPKRIDKYDKLVCKEMYKRVHNFLTFTQQSEVDPIGFGLRYEATHLHNRDTAAEWKELYPDLEFKVNVQANIKSIGAIE